MLHQRQQVNKLSKWEKSVLFKPNALMNEKLFRSIAVPKQKSLFFLNKKPKAPKR
jgi:hypothetical protein